MRKTFIYEIWTLQYNPYDGSFMPYELMGDWTVSVSLGIGDVLQRACKLFLGRESLESNYTISDSGEITLCASNGSPLMTLTPVSN